jgi:hypothetical protein
MWRSNAVMYVTVPYKKVLFSILIFFTSQSELDFGIALVLLRVKYGLGDWRSTPPSTYLSVLGIL